MTAAAKLDVLTSKEDFFMADAFEFGLSSADR